jgi:hypothetical protein
LNPLDYWFREICSLLKKEKLQSLNDITGVLQKYIGVDFKKYIREMDKYINKGIRKE